MKVAIYIRVSTADQFEHGYSVDEQRDVLEEYANRNKMSIYHIYIDGGHSGSNLNRPAMQKLIRDAKDRKFDALLIYKLDRLTRNLRDTLYFFEDIIAAYNINFISYVENIDTTTVSGQMIINMYSMFSQMELTQIRDRMRMGKLGRAKSGKAMAWAQDPFGYKYENDTYVIVPLEAEVVKSMFRLYLKSGSITNVVTTLNEEGHIGKDIPWSYRTVKQVLDNPIYIGKNQYLGSVYDGNHEPIINDEVFNKAQVSMEEGRRAAHNPRPFESKYLLSGLIRCSRCGSPMMAVLHKKRKDGTRKKVYRCKSYKKFAGAGKNYSHIKCDSQSLPMDELEFEVLSQIEKIRRNPELVSSESDDVAEKIEIYEREVEKFELQREKLLDLYLEGTIEKSSYETRHDSLMVKIDNLHSKLSVLTDEQIMEESRVTLIDEINAIPSNVFKLDKQTQHQMIRKLIDVVRVDVGRVKIEWKF